ncbi:Alg9-like mannosyltransferase family-domain-containing protein [Syncephalastrum racemosum]|uniref:Mannosyltransferase n=1 Tax=Syncephalastrum racemosum TaxID=13706 RepID=A0A1X2HKN7_SYNRA|nr:Alg9-like mannosyltransferase family-domain-containing protein [Syncephalastrum racemosum]
MLQAVLAAVADYSTYSLGKKLMGDAIAPYMLFTLLSSWYLFFMAGRTLSNTMETVLTITALNDWPLSLASPNWKKGYTKALVWASLACVMRPTNALLWVFLGGHLLYRAKGHRWTVAMLASLITGTVMASNVAVDTRIYTGAWGLSSAVLTPVNFIRVNVLQSISVIYGVHPWHWYLSQGIPVVLTTYLPFAIFGYQKSRHNAETRHIGHLVLYVIGVYSLLSHKEFRFIFPIVPLLLIFAAKGLKETPPRWKRMACVVLLCTQVPMAIYLSLAHQRGVMDAMLWVREQQPASVGVLMPCHSTPWQSVVHAPDMDMWFLTCEPPLRDDELDEADLFYTDPAGFLREMDRPWPTALLMFDNLLPSIQSLLDAQGYREDARFFNTHFHDDWRRRGDVLVLCRE